MDVRRSLRDERGLASPVEMMFMLAFCVLAVLFLGFVGRLHAAGVQVANVAQSAARSASMASGPAAARAAAAQVVQTSPLGARCIDGAHLSMSWRASAVGTWQGGAVHVSVSCNVSNQSLTGVWSPGRRSVVMGDTQVVDRYRR
ncbi:MAG: hypothetical protein ACOYMR_10080 [Ilumatobacteraceae bacterium]